MSEPESDQTLVERANAGDVAAFEALYYRYRDWVAALAYRFTGNREDALDVVQETFAYFFSKFPGFELESAVKTFLYPAIKHRCISRRRRERPTVDIDEVAPYLPAADPPEHAFPSSDLVRFVQRLPAGQREVVLLRFADDMSLEQIAAALLIPLGTVKSRLHNALEKLREEHRR